MMHPPKPPAAHMAAIKQHLAHRHAMKHWANAIARTAAILKNPGLMQGALKLHAMATSPIGTTAPPSLGTQVGPTLGTQAPQPSGTGQS